MCILTRGERFKDARTVHNQHGSQSMNDVYEATGVSASMIKELEDDEKNRSVGYEKIAILAKHYGVSADFLLGLTKDPSVHPSAVDELGLSKESVQFLKEISKKRGKWAHEGMMDIINFFLNDFATKIFFEFMCDYARYAKGDGIFSKCFDLIYQGRDSTPELDKLFEEEFTKFVESEQCPAELKDYVESEDWVYKTHMNAATPTLKSVFTDIGAFDVKAFMEFRLKDTISSAIDEIWKSNKKQGYEFVIPDGVMAQGDEVYGHH